ncbi:DNA-directed RNA polymerase I subunit RPA2 [Acrasis kona]|uniref:DNA-directed RNA polymerase subunit beta n=1 Tax=Acrasis kona TaxID=1008807 RepID=A0AAW2Z1C8_9EUKA
MVFEPNVKDDLRLQESVQAMTAPHIDSFNYMVRYGLRSMVKTIPPLRMHNTQIRGQTIELTLENMKIEKPVHQSETTRKMLPYQARISHADYSGALNITFMVKVNNNPPIPLTFKTAYVPVMVSSDLCYLKGKDPVELTKAHEEPHEAGGYFIIKGSEKVCRLLIANLRGYPLCISRSSWAKRNPNATEKGAMIRCVRDDGTFETNIVIYCNDGTTTMTFGSGNTQTLSSIILLKALKKTSDLDLFLRILEPKDIRNKLNVDRVLTMLSVIRTTQPDRHTCEDFLDLISHSSKSSNEGLTKKERVRKGQDILDRDLLVHLDSNAAKFDMLIFMIQKLLRYVDNKIDADSPDVFGLQECQSPGQTYTAVLRQAVNNFDFESDNYAAKLIKASYPSIASAVRTFISTGNLNTTATQRYNDQKAVLTQFSGLSVMADKINYFRFISHFRSIHRGAFWMDSRVTDVRKLRPDQFGFICPVHTPDGAPCGLLNHLTHPCTIHMNMMDKAERQQEEHLLIEALLSLGMRFHRHHRIQPNVDQEHDMRQVTLNGQVVGVIQKSNLVSFAHKLRHIKVTKSDPRIPSHIEIVPLPEQMGGTLYLATSSGRFQRPVISLATNQIESIGALEGIFLNIAITTEHIKKGTTHIEINPNNMLSNVGNLTPFSDFNQSPRNVYQCQMAKQTMGFPLFSFPYRTDNKLYRLQTPQKALARTQHQDKIPADDYPLGTNAVVAVISYTGYDMEDAMIVNKSSYDRGLGKASIYKTQAIDLLDYDKDGKIYFDNRRSSIKSGGQPKKNKDEAQQSELIVPTLDSDGLPPVGLLLELDDPIFCYYDSVSNSHKQIKWKSVDPGYVDNIKIVGYRITPDRGASERGQPLNSVSTVIVTFRLPRNPTIGDKFSSRHGQKGIMSMLWPTEDMPFTNSGITPDIIINPHAFPSRMTIGMLIESMASKAGALHGFYPDATAFQFDEHDNRAVDHYGALLSKAGFNYHGNEMMYSGTLGREMQADIFLGVVYYQRLRHMVSDKFQVRSKGPIDRLTHQPVKGRKKGGGVRFGEMERDGLLAYGASFIVRDRLLHCSDEDIAHVCTNCGSMLSTVLSTEKGAGNKHTCKTCKNDANGLQVITIPYVLRYLANELAGMNINMVIKLSS